MRIRRLIHAALPLSLFLALPSGASAQAPAVAPDLIDGMRTGFTEVAARVLQAAESVPESQYGYRPTSAVRSMGQLIGHIADGNNYYCRRAAGSDPEWKETVALSGAGKAELIARLKESITLCTEHKAGNAARSGELLANYGHVNHHYGNLVTYLRLLGMTPPS